MAIQERWSSSELQAQFRRGAFERAVLSPARLSPLVRELPWSHKPVFLGKSKRLEERESNLRRSIDELLSNRELGREFRQTPF